MPQIFETARPQLAREVRRRTQGRELMPGGWYAEGDLLLATRRTMLTVRATEGAGCHWLDLRDPDPQWSVVVPRVDLANRRIDEMPRNARAVATRRRRPLVRARRRARAPRDDGQLSLPLVDHGASARDEKRLAVSRFFEAIPPRHRTAISPAPPRWQWELLIFFDQGGVAASELLESTPALAFALALSPLFADGLVPPVDEVLTWRQSRIAELLGFPKSRRGVRALRKLEARDLDAALLLNLKRLLRDEQVLARISHLPRLSRSLLQVARTPECFMALERDSQMALLDPQRGPRLARQLEFMVERLERLRRRGYDVPQSIRSWQHAEVVANTIGELLDEVGPLDAPDPVPPPPFPGIPGVIEPLRSAGDFHEEGSAMHNCVRSYVGAAMEGDIALYRVLQPERATLSVVRCSDSRWRLGELHAVGNTRVGAETREEVNRWLQLWREPGRVPIAIAGEGRGTVLGPVYDPEGLVDFDEFDDFDEPGPGFIPIEEPNRRNDDDIPF